MMYMKANYNSVLFIVAGKGFFRDGVLSDGYKVLAPYVEHNLIERVLRELCFRLPFLPNKIWYNKEVSKENVKYIFVSDPLITVDYLKWLQFLFPNAQLNFTYGNMVGKAKHIKPCDIPEGWRVWTYDDYDARTYGLRLYHVNAYPKSFLKPKMPSEYDVLFVGKDKGRGDYLLQLERKMKLMGLKTLFIIARDGKLSPSKKYYKKAIPYEDVVELIVKSRAILNIAMEGQEGMTMRDLESMFFGVKLLTTNKNVVKMDFYHPENVYIVDGLNIDDLPQFLNISMVEVPDEVKNKHTFDSFIEFITESA